MENIYIQHKGKVVQTDERFEHVMAITLNPKSSYKHGVIRCITSRTGDVQVAGYVDRSRLYNISGSSLENFIIGEPLKIKGENEIVADLTDEGFSFIGLEDPDIWIDDKTGLMHLYFTMPFRGEQVDRTDVHLGHAVGKNLDSLEMTMPVLMADFKHFRGAKEVSIAPVNKQGFRYNLVESGKREPDFNYSTVMTAVAYDMGEDWQYAKLVFHPKEHKIPWIGGHASPGPLLPKTFIDVGEGKLLGIMNGREANQSVGEETKYGMFSVGLFIYDYENGKIEWVSDKPIIIDSEAVTITFASQFVPGKPGEGILFAHVDDSFVRAYTLLALGIKPLIP